MFLVESAEKPDRPFRTGNPETTARRIWVRVTPGIGSVFLIHPTGQKRQEKKRFFLEWGRNAFVRHAAFSKHDAILQRIQPWPRKIPIPT